MTLDYRGMGGSCHGAGIRSVRVDHWIEEDIPLAVEKMAWLTRAPFVGVFAHSLAGQLLGQSPVVERVNGALFWGCQRGIPSLFQGLHYLRAQYAYWTFPLLIRLLGQLPTSRVTFPAQTPPQVVLQWIRWGRQGRFRNAKGEDTEGRFARFRGPLLSLRASDDHDYAPAPAVKALERLYTGAHLTSDTLSPSEFGLTELGHFGVFSARAPKSVFDRLHQGLMNLVSLEAQPEVAV
jgi:predicted alpha/beta hydrolase